MKKTLFFFLISVLSAKTPLAAAHRGKISGEDWGIKTQMDHAKNIAPFPLMHAVYHGELAEIKRLLAGGINPNLTDNFGWTALISAALKGQTEAVKALLKNGAKPNLEDNNGRTALMWAASTGQAETAKILLDNGANPDIKDKEGKTAWDYIKGKKQMELILSEWKEKQ